MAGKSPQFVECSVIVDSLVSAYEKDPTGVWWDGILRLNMSPSGANVVRTKNFTTTWYTLAYNYPGSGYANLLVEIANETMGAITPFETTDSNGKTTQRLGKPRVAIKQFKVNKGEDKPTIGDDVDFRDKRNSSYVMFAYIMDIFLECCLRNPANIGTAISNCYAGKKPPSIDTVKQFCDQAIAEIPHKLIILNKQFDTTKISELLPGFTIVTVTNSKVPSLIQLEPGEASKSITYSSEFAPITRIDFKLESKNPKGNEPAKTISLVTSHIRMRDPANPKALVPVLFEGQPLDEANIHKVLRSGTVIPTAYVDYSVICGSSQGLSCIPKMTSMVVEFPTSTVSIDDDFLTARLNAKAAKNGGEEVDDEDDGGITGLV